MKVKFLALYFFVISIACSEKSEKEEKVVLQSINFSGCNRSLKNGAEALSYDCSVKYELLANNKLKIIRNVQLNCAIESVSANLDANNNTIYIEEIANAKNAAFCNCNTTYEYVVGPLYLKEYEIKIISPNNEKYSFNLNLDNLISGDICK